MKTLVTGGAGFIGRWVVAELLGRGMDVVVLDDLSNGKLENLDEFKNHPHFKSFVKGDIKDLKLCQKLLKETELCLHLGASINVQDSIDEPRTTFENDVNGTFNILETCRENNVRLVFVSTCMVYERADNKALTEQSAVRPASPYAASKLAGENLVLSYAIAYNLPFTVLRPFNTYGPFQKSSGEGGVVSIFVKQALKGEKLRIYGDGTQTRDLLYVEDCARFIVEAGLSNKTGGEVINAATGHDIAINDLALMIGGSKEKLQHVEHIHPQSEIARLVGSADKAKKLMGWEAKFKLEQGIARTREWIAKAEAVK